MHRIIMGGAIALLLLAGNVQRAAAQTVTAVPKLDLSKFMGTWYEIARLPNKAEKKCVRNVKVLYALGDKKGTFQMGTSCDLKDSTPDDYDGTGKMDKQGDGRLKLNRLVFLSTPYWVLATGPEDAWALVGSPKHKTLWILSRTSSLDAGALTQIKSMATAQGFDLAKLITVVQGQ